jgi:putative restriction endonuclease
LRGFVANTDQGWFDYLAGQPPLDEVNFWKLSDVAFKALQPGEPFFFRLKAPHRAIGGFGFFRMHTVVPLQLAWDAFGPANGAPDWPTLLRHVAALRKVNRVHGGDVQLGCRIVCEPVFFAPGDWVADAADWSDRIQGGQGFDLAHGEGRRIWHECLVRRAALPDRVEREPDDAPHERFGRPRLVASRLGQGSFRLAVTDAYDRACAVTGDHTLPALEAAHIRPYSREGRHSVTNGLLLRADVHKLYDQGYVTVTPDLQFRVSDRLAGEFRNGRVYYEFQGRRIRMPNDLTDRPDRDALAWHMDEVFLG